MEYIVKAYSAQANQTQREINLMSAHPTSQADAQQWADSFAQRLSQQQFLGARDWQGQVELVDSQHARTL
jgi:hypothetical protein